MPENSDSPMPMDDAEGEPALGSPLGDNPTATLLDKFIAPRPSAEIYVTAIANGGTKDYRRE